MKDLNKDITRKDAIKKMGKYAALTAAGTFLILNPKKLKHFQQDLVQMKIHWETSLDNKLNHI